ncbi:MAG: T9SS sorting signal type C domain-containing protein, partial [Flavobacterium sp.]
MRKILQLNLTAVLLLVAMVTGVNMSAQGTLSNPIFSENFGALNNATNLSTGNTAFSYVRVGTSSGSNPNQIRAINPGSFTGASATISAAGGSVSTVDKTGLSSFSSGTFTMKVKTPSTLGSGTILSAVGNGTSFGSNNGFTGAQLSAAFQITGTSLQVRSAGNWTTVQTVAANTIYEITIVFNNSASTLNYGDSRTLASNRCHVWVNSAYIGEYTAATNNLAATSFRIYATTSQIEVDDVAVYNTLPVGAPVNAPVLAVTGNTAHGSVCPNTSGATMQYTITNTGTVAATGVTVTAGGTDASMFAVSGLSSTTIAANGGTATYNVVFTPTSNGAKTAAITVASTTTNSNSPVSNVTGTGATVAATVTTAAASAITATSATLGGNVTVEGCSPVTARGVVIGTSANPALGGTGVTTLSSGSGIGAFSVPSGSILTPATVYHVRAYATNSVGATVYGIEISFTTACATVSAFPFTESFDAVTLPACWTNEYVSGTANWNTVTQNSNNTITPRTGARMANFYTENINQNTTRLVSPPLDITSISNPELKFYYANVNWEGDIDELRVYYKTSAAGAWVQIGTNYTQERTAWTEVTLSLPNPSSTYYIAFEGKSNYARGVNLDDVSVYSAIPQPTLTTNGVTALSFGQVGISDDSASQTFNLSGTTLAGAPGTITVTASNTDFEVSADNITFTPSINVAYGSATLASTPVFVRFTPATTGAKAGTLTISGGGVVTSPTISLTGTGVIPVPVATAATEVSNRKFRANWNTVDVAESYRLDVSTLETFGTNAPAVTTIETFENIPGTSSSYAQRDWTGVNGITWSSNFARTDQTINGKAITLSDTGGAFLLSGEIPGGLSNLSFDVQQVFAGSNGLLTISVLSGQNFMTETVIGTKSYTSSVESFTNNAITGITGTYKIKIQNSGARAKIDNLSFTSLAVFTPSYVAGYNNLLVSGPTQLVTGLNPNTQYFYRVRTVTGSEISLNSNTISVTTTNFNTWDGIAWSLGTPPSIADNAIIEGNYDTADQDNITALNLWVDGGALTVAEETTVTVANALAVNTGTVTVENNGMLMQSGTTNQNTGAITFNRNSAELFRQDYTMWSSPVAGQNVFNFSSGTVLSRFYTYNTATDHYESMFATPADAQGVTFTAGEGYLIRMPNGSDVPGYIAGTASMKYNGRFIGVPNNGTIAVDLSVAAQGFNAVGNPYPSAIDADAFITANAIANQRIDGTLYFWRKRNGVEGDAYATYTYLGGTAGSGQAASSNDPDFPTPLVTETPNGRIQSGQGFIVRAVAGGQQEIFTNAMRVADFSQEDQFFRNSNSVTQTAEKHRLWLNMQNAEGLVYQTLVGYMDNATNNLDVAIDGKKFDEVADGFYSVLTDAKLSIQGRALPFNAADVVPMGYKSTVAGSHTINLAETDGLFAQNQDIFLRDNVLGVTHNLKDGAYTFATEAGSFDNRFEVVYTQALGTDNPIADTNSIVVYKQGSTININAGTIEMTGVAVYDIQGRQLYNQTGINATEAVISNLQSQQQVLIVQITTAKNGKVSR